MSLSAALLDLQQLTERLRLECPWDREQTLATIVPYTVEEAYEVADAALAEKPDKLVDELGDLLFQVYFLSLLLEEAGQGDLAEVARRVHAKLVRRHPHVFGDAQATTAGRVRAGWDQVKRDEEGRSGIFHDVPGSLPALIQARKVQRRAAAVGFDFPGVAGALEDVDNELAELREEVDGRADPAPELPPDRRQAEELGDLLFACVNVARRLNIDPELELRRASGRFVARVEAAERLAAEAGERWTELGLAQQDRYFDLAKERE